MRDALPLLLLLVVRRHHVPSGNSSREVPQASYPNVVVTVCHHAVKTIKPVESVEFFFAAVPYDPARLVPQPLPPRVRVRVRVVVVVVAQKSSSLMTTPLDPALYEPPPYSAAAYS